MKSQKKNPKISIVIPSYNQGQYLEQTILSILNQNYLYIEIIVIDGASTDSSVEIIKKYQDQLSYWISEPDNGQGHAINKGFEKATGDILGWINSDDYYLPGYFNEVAKAFQKKAKLEVVYSNSITLDERTNSSYPEYGKYMIDAFFRYGGSIYSHTVFWKRAIHENINENIHCAMDYELWMRLMKGRKYKHINYFGAVFRMQNQSKSMLGDKDFKLKWDTDYIYIQKKHQITHPNIWLHRLYRYLNLIYSNYCALKFKDIDLTKLR